MGAIRSSALLLLLCTLGAMPGRAQAQDDADRDLGHPYYLPLQGQFAGTSVLAFSATTYSNYNAAGTKLGDDGIHEFNLIQGFSYGIRDDLAVSLTDTLALGNTDAGNAHTGAGTVYVSDGFDNPVIGIVYRILDRRYGLPLDVDLSATYSPNLIPRKNANPDNAGYVADSGQVATFGIDAGGALCPRVLLYGHATATYQGTRNTQFLGTGSSAVFDSYWSYDVGVVSQWTLNERFALGAGFHLTFENNAGGQDVPSGQTWLTRNPEVSDFNLVLNYHVVPDRLLLQLSYDHLFYSNITRDYAVPADDVQTRGETGNIIGLHLQYLLN